MYDFHKQPIRDEKDICALLQNQNLSFTGSFDRNTGEAYQYPLTHQSCYKIVVKSPHYAEISGSFHKSAQSGFNDEDYTIMDHLKETQKLTELTGLNPYNSQISCLEFGVNLHHSISPKVFRKTLLHGSKWMNSNQIGKTAKYSQWEFKLYDKKTQLKGCKVINPCIRIENHYRYAEKIKMITGLAKLSLMDLFDYSIQQKLKEHLLKTWDEIYIIESLPTNLQVTKPNKKLLTDWSNSSHIEELLASNPRKFRRERSKARELYRQYAISNYHGSIRKLIAQKVDNLLYMDDKTWSDLKHFQGHWNRKNLVGFKS